MCDRRGSLLYKLFWAMLHGYIKSISSDSKLTVSKLSTDLTVV